MCTHNIVLISDKSVDMMPNSVGFDIDYTLLPAYKTVLWHSWHMYALIGLRHYDACG